MAACISFFFSSRRRHTRFDCDWSSDVCSSDLPPGPPAWPVAAARDGEVQVRALEVGAASDELEPRTRSEERRVGKECRSRGSRGHEKKKNGTQVRVAVSKRISWRTQRTTTDDH